MTRHTRRRIASIAAAASLGILIVPRAPALAQAAPPVKPGSRVRVVTTVPDSGTRLITGRLLELSGDTVALQTDSTVQTLVLEPNERLEVFNGYGNGALGALAGIAGGAGIGALLYARFEKLCDARAASDCPLFQPRTRADAASRGALVGGLCGLVLGVTIGRQIRSGHWIPVLGHIGRVRVTPGRVGISLRF